MFYVAMFDFGLLGVVLAVVAFLIWEAITAEDNKAKTVYRQSEVTEENTTQKVKPVCAEAHVHVHVNN
jgi:hypothetical protein